MFVCTRDEALESIRVAGANACAYFGDWPDNFCDCKYGGPKPSGEQTGCPELRTLHLVVTALTDEEWENARRRAGGIRPSELFGPGEIVEGEAA